MTDPVAGIVVLEIRGIRTPGDLFLPEVGFDVRPSDREKRADDASADGFHTGDALQAASAAELHEYGLRIVLPVVGHCDQHPLVGVGFLLPVLRFFIKSSIAEISAGFLRGDPVLFRELQSLHRNDAERDLVLSAERFHILCVPVRFRSPDPVVNVHHTVLCPEDPSKLDKDMKKCGGIRASADTDDDSVPSADHARARNELPDFILNLQHR